MNQTVEVKLLGTKFRFNITEEVKPEDFFEIVSYVEKKLSRIKNDTVDLDSYKLALLASINIAEEYFSVKKENENLKKLLNRIEKSISPLYDADEKENTELPIKFSS